VVRTLLLQLADANNCQTAHLGKPTTCGPVYGPPKVVQNTSNAGVVQGSVKEAVKGEVVRHLEAQAGFGSALLDQMSHAHPQPGSANDASLQRYSQLQQPHMCLSGC
jgi:hypothetical protein